ncbi:MAG TPA: hypothetical protein VLA82_07840 [Actinomycetota bacterium]|nr:hypothetical protein [Actinomycetota bacterium]
MATTIPILVEVGTKRVFAMARDWPGWSRRGRDEMAAVESLDAYADRYGAVVAGIGGRDDVRAGVVFEVVERFRGGPGTDFGAPDTQPAVDASPVAGRDLERLVAILRACWDAFDAAATAAGDAALRTGPRGGGRDLAKILAHVTESAAAHLRSVGGRASSEASLEQIREAYVEAVRARARGELPDVGPRGGKRWSARFGVRYAAWHALDHAWEIEDRVER